MSVATSYFLGLIAFIIVTLNLIFLGHDPNVNYTAIVLAILAVATKPRGNS